MPSAPPSRRRPPATTRSASWGSCGPTARRAAGVRDQALEADPAFTTPIATPEEWARHHRDPRAGRRVGVHGGRVGATVGRWTRRERRSTRCVPTSWRPGPRRRSTRAKPCREVVRQLADTMDAAVADFDTFAREMAAVGARNALDVPPPNTPPTASFTATPSVRAGTVGRRLQCLRFERTPRRRSPPTRWDFGDGSTGIRRDREPHVHDGGRLHRHPDRHRQRRPHGLHDPRRSPSSEEVPNVPPTAVATATTPAVGPGAAHRRTQRRGSSDPDGTIVSLRLDVPGRLDVERSGRADHARGGRNRRRHADSHRRRRRQQRRRPSTLRATAPPVARFTRTPAGGAPPLAVQFDATTSADEVGITGYAWSFGDGATGTGADAAAHLHDSRHVHRHADRHRHRRSNGAGIEHRRGRRRQPAAGRGRRARRDAAESSRSFSVFPTASDPDGEIVSYAWDYGDGTTSDGTSRQPHVRNEGHVHGDPDGHRRRGRDGLRLTVGDDRQRRPVIYQLDVPARALPGVALAMSAFVQDPGGLDTVTGSWDFGDGSDRRAGTAPESIGVARLGRAGHLHRHVAPRRR